MDSHKGLLFSLILGLLALSFGQEKKDDNKIYWSKTSSLRWTDFNGRPRGTHAAESVVGFSPEVIAEDSEINTKVILRTYFITNKSWATEKAKTHDQLLQHEKGHFDIAEIYCRKFKKLLAEGRLKRKTFRKKLNSIHHDIYRQFHAYQQKYDFETDHCRDEAIQKKWEEKIDLELLELEKYSESAVIITFRSF